jgi:hypothetical protein
MWVVIECPPFCGIVSWGKVRSTNLEQVATFVAVVSHLKEAKVVELPRTVARNEQ